MKKDKMNSDDLFIDDNETELDLLIGASNISDEEINKINKEYDNLLKNN